jgi:hypothetical protein
MNDAPLTPRELWMTYSRGLRDGAGRQGNRSYCSNFTPCQRDAYLDGYFDGQRVIREQSLKKVKEYGYEPQVIRANEDNERSI